jgi:hypothetical protein
MLTLELDRVDFLLWIYAFSRASRIPRLVRIAQGS